MTSKNNDFLQNNKGFTLLELLLVVGLAATMIVSFGRLSTLWANRQLADLSGIHMQRITEIVENHIRTDHPAVGGDITGTIAANLPIGLTMTNPLRRDIEVELLVTATEYRAIIYTNGAIIPHNKLLPAARAAGASGGLVTNIVTAANIAESAFGLWTANLGDFGVGPTVDADGGQLVSYLSFSIDEVFGAYLYRNDMGVGNENLNTMFTDLNMNGNAIRAVDSVETNDMDIYNTATIQQLQVDGNTTFAGSVDITGALDVGNQMVIDGDLTVSNGDVVVDGGTINAASMDVGTARASIINAPDISATSLSVTGANSILASDLTITGGVTIEIDGEIQANTLNANQLTAQGVTTNQMTVNNNVTVNGDAIITGSAVMDVLAVDDCLTIQPSGLNDQYGPNC